MGERQRKGEKMAPLIIGDQSIKNAAVVAKRWLRRSKEKSLANLSKIRSLVSPGVELMTRHPRIRGHDPFATVRTHLEKYFTEIHRPDRSHVVIHSNKIRANCTREKRNIGLQDVIPKLTEVTVPIVKTGVLQPSNVISAHTIKPPLRNGRFLIHRNCQVIYSQFGLAIHQNDHQARRRFVEWAQNEIAVVPDFHKRILFSDEAHFWLNGYVNKQNCRIWSEANLQVYVETPLHPKKLNVWCALWAGGIIGPYFFKNDEGHDVTVNGDRYRAMITNFFIPELNNHDVQEL
ncbi:hypothetical protein TNCV_3750031 [Trichonephila clavipes]|nr:hypothetical protein TNCV_3750031 [Trichonephila clavipes]